MAAIRQMMSFRHITVVRMSIELSGDGISTYQMEHSMRAPLRLTAKSLANLRLATLRDPKK